MNEVATLTEKLHAAIRAGALDVEIDPDTLTIEPILNWGGFVNRSFRISDGRRQYFLKLSRDRDNQRALRRWHSLANILETRYHAPYVHGWIDVTGTAYAGAVSDWLDGEIAEHLSPALKVEVSRVIARLHADEELAHRLRRDGDAIVSCVEAWLESYSERFEEDIASIAIDPPPFVSRGDVAWMEDEVIELSRRVHESEAFQHPADRPIHGDLWANNILLTRKRRWHVLDWDGLQLGDPVMDWAMLFGPSRAMPYALDEKEVLAHVPLDEPQRQRLQLYARATQLDWVIDPLADWVAAAEEPHGDQIRESNRRVHERALAAYKTRYGAGTS